MTVAGWVAALLLVSCSERHKDEAAPAAEATPVRAAPLVVLGLDAFDLEVAEPLLAAGKLPNFRRLIDSGAHGVLYSEREMRSPALWTTIATGRPRDVHHVYDFVTGSRLWPAAQQGGEQRLVTSDMRGAPALWNIASDAGKKVAVVGWLNTWPAEPVRGTMVSPYVAVHERKQITIKGGIYEDETRQVHPRERWKEIRSLIVAPEDIPDEELRVYASDPGDAARAAFPILARNERALRWSLARTLTVQRITMHLEEQDSPDVIVAYHEGADSLAHRFWLFRQSHDDVVATFQELGLPTEHVDTLRAAYGGVIDAYYLLLDDMLGAMMRALPADTRWIVVSDHGFGNRSGRYPANAEVPFTGEHRLEGTVILAGGDVPAGSRIFGATQYDVLPTALSLLGVTPAAGLALEGQVLVPTLLASEEAPETAQESGDFEAEELERLRSLGYVQ